MGRGGGKGGGGRGGGRRAGGGGSGSSPGIDDVRQTVKQLGWQMRTIPEGSRLGQQGYKYQVIDPKNRGRTNIIGKNLTEVNNIVKSAKREADNKPQVVALSKTLSGLRNDIKTPGVSPRVRRQLQGAIEDVQRQLRDLRGY